jgi:Kdo2-lipid IVA lauroyltransferase/acyltransferase
LARLSRIFTPSKWRTVEANLAVIEAWTGRRTRPDEVFENFAVTLSDFLSQAPVDVVVEGRERAEKARSAGRGVIFLTSHLGHWELGGRILSDWGWPATAVYKPYRSRVMQRFIQKRRAAGLNYLAVGRGAAAGVAQVLQRGENVALLGDWPFGEEGVPAVVCGRPAKLPRGPLLFACRYGAPVVPAFVVREAPGRYRALVEEPLWPGGKTPRDVDDLVRRVAGVLETYFSAYTGQWYCFERFWE